MLILVAPVNKNDKSRAASCHNDLDQRAFVLEASERETHDFVYRFLQVA